MRDIILIITFFIFQQTLFAANDFYSFHSKNEQVRFETLTKQLRCLVCQNQNLSESNAPLANDLRDQIYQQIEAGQPDKAIIDYLVMRYGDFILYRPPLNKNTVGLWFGPLFLLMFGIIYLIYTSDKENNNDGTILCIDCFITA